MGRIEDPAHHRLLIPYVHGEDVGLIEEGILKYVPFEQDLVNFAVTAKPNLYEWPGVDNNIPLPDNCEIARSARKADFSVASSYSSAVLGLVTSAGEPTRTLDLSFSAAFAFQNPELWPQFLKCDPRVGAGERAQIKFNLGTYLFKNLEKLSTRGPKVPVSTVVRAAAAWLIRELITFLSGPTRRSNKIRKQFFERFYGGRNRIEAATAPVLLEIEYRYKHSLDEAPKNWDDPKLVQTLIENSFKESFSAWQFERAKILRWPSLPDLGIPFRTPFEVECGSLAPSKCHWAQGLVYDEFRKTQPPPFTEYRRINIPYRRNLMKSFEPLLEFATKRKDKNGKPILSFAIPDGLMRIPHSADSKRMWREFAEKMSI